MCTIGAKLANNIPTNQGNHFQTYLAKRVAKSIYLEAANIIEIANTILFLNVNKAVSHDKIPAYFLKIAPFTLAHFHIRPTRSEDLFFVFVQDSSTNLPQGSTLGPLLFLLYVNDLSNAVQSAPRLFADDTCLLLSHLNHTILQEKLNQEVSLLCNWCNSNNLTINP